VTASLADRLSRLPEDVLSFARAAAEAARAAGTEAVLVGGAVRDLFLGRAVLDADVMVEPPSTPVAEALAGRFKAKLTRHPRFHTFRLDLPDGSKHDLVTAREETYAQPAALPDVTPSTFDKDLSRRDFTINAMMCRLDPAFGEVHDPFQGRADLEKKQIRALHAKSFEDDPTRIFRAARFAARLGFTVEPATADWIRAAIAGKFPDRLSPVRRRHELELILKEGAPTAALRLLANWDALRHLHPEWGGADLAPLRLDGTPALVDRLAALFGGNGADAADRAMTALSFEKAVKRDVLSKLRR
jgi:tRNA nucleotidyltransferase (CCA-adding enzyme)